MGDYKWGGYIRVCCCLNINVIGLIFGIGYYIYNFEMNRIYLFIAYLYSNSVYYNNL